MFKIPAQSLTSCVTLGKLLKVSVCFLFCRNNRPVINRTWFKEMTCWAQSKNYLGIADRDDVMFPYIMLRIGKKSLICDYSLY